MRRSSLLLLVLILFSAAFADLDHGSPSEPAYILTDNVLRGHMNEYAVSLVHQLSSEKGSVSVFAAPFSILTALSSMIPVTGAQTQYQLKEALFCHVSGMLPTDVLMNTFAQVQFCF